MAKIFSEVTKVTNINSTDYIPLILSDGSIARIKKTDLLTSINISGKGLYTDSSQPEGILITTDIKINTNTFFLLEIKGNGYSVSNCIYVILQGYVYNNNNILQSKSISLLQNIPICAFFLNGVLCFWLQSKGGFQSFWITCRKNSGSNFHSEDAVINVELATKPSSVVGLVEVIPIVIT